MMDVRCIFEARSALAESALWHPGEQALYWLDQFRPEIHRLDPATGKDTKFDLDLPPQLGGLVLTAEGGMALAASDGITVLSPDMRNRTTLVNPIAGRPNISFNDAKCDRQGRLWAGTTDRVEAEALGQLYRIDADGAATMFADGFVCSNGPSFSPDGRTMYHSCTLERVINAFDIDPDTGEASNSRPFVRFDGAKGAPDGSTVDAEGYLWSTHWGGGRVTRHAADGTIDFEIAIPVKNVTSCAFGGPNLDTLFVTTASVEFANGGWVFMDDAGFDAAPMTGGIFAIEVGIRGLPEPVFGAR
ncbi:SMP-30/gluconolactonase/LRE family protein [Mesorhizobium sp.]|uniref:SMP-30/gluconolactonase/LRE family protein n=1 Tax=Mesorhizobium sp. TaxID=1871066 RepID=UPI000FE98989|nr:SMP-30/gluconolactonase/LRE family protein [Mesorhizobium sp.]RWB70993.1 MAG: SMP-30/gluconolactonase/LRE family protein [Mesorhizobium sp.]